MSAFLAGDLGGTVISYPSLQTLSGSSSPGSGSLGYGDTVGKSVDLNHADTICNLNVVGLAVTNLSGQVRIGVQCSDSDVSGNYTDPTSGLQTFPSWFASGGIIWLNSGGVLGGTIQGAIAGSPPSLNMGVPGLPAGFTQANSGSPNSGYAIASGFNVFASFQRTGRFARAFVVSGDLGYLGPLTVSFVSQLRTTGSGGGMTYSPSSGQVNV